MKQWNKSHFELLIATKNVLFLLCDDILNSNLWDSTDGIVSIVLCFIIQTEMPMLPKITIEWDIDKKRN